jgi:signal peptidase I
VETTPDSIASAKNELAAEVLRSSGRLRFRATGSSMLPTIRPGDVVLIHRCSIDEPVLGDIVLFTRHRRLFAHRVTARCRAGLVTQGDGNAKPDPSIDASELLGKVSEIIRRGKPIRTGTTLTPTGRMSAALVRRSARAGRLLTRLHGLRNRLGV